MKQKNFGKYTERNLKNCDTDIIIACTFREFDGGINDKIQRKFLQSLKSQTINNNFCVVATTFGEKNIKKTLDELNILNDTFVGDNGAFQCSQTEVLINAIRIAKERNSKVIIWTTCDIVYHPKFLEEMMKEFQSGWCFGPARLRPQRD